MVSYHVAGNFDHGLSQTYHISNTQALIAGCTIEHSLMSTLMYQYGKWCG